MHVNQHYIRTRFTLPHTLRLPTLYFDLAKDNKKPVYTYYVPTGSNGLDFDNLVNDIAQHVDFHPDRAPTP